MKHILAIAAVVFCTGAFATGSHTDNSNHHNPDNSTQTGDFQGQQQWQDQESHSNAHSSTNSNVQATTGDATSSSNASTGASRSRSSAQTGDSSATSNSRGGQASSQSQGGASHGGSNSGQNVVDSSKSYAVALPTPLNVPNITPATAMCSLSEASGFAIGFNFFSKTGAKQVIDKLCVVERQAAAFEAQCKFRTAAAIRYWLLREITTSEELSEIRYDRRYGTEGNPMNVLVKTNLGSELADFLKEANASPWAAEEDMPSGSCSY